MYIATYILSLLDLAFTLYFKYRFGNEIEGNPIGKLIIQNTFIAVFVKVVLVGVAILALYWLRNYRLAQISIEVLFSIYALLLLYHCFLIAKVHYLIFIATRPRK